LSCFPNSSLVIVLSVLPFTASDYPFGIFCPLSVLRFTASDYSFWYLLVIVLSVLLLFTAPDYPFGIFKLVLRLRVLLINLCNCCVYPYAFGFEFYITSDFSSNNSQPQVIKFTRCLPMVGGSLRVLRLLPPLILVAMI